MRVIYLVFNEGYSASAGPQLIRADLCEEAIRLARILAQSSPHPEVDGLLALMLLQDSRRASRTSATGDIILFDEQDRALWDQSKIAEALGLVESALKSGEAGRYALQAAILALYAESADSLTVDYAQIVALYDLWLAIEPSKVVRLARAIALAGRDGAVAALPIVEVLALDPELRDYEPVHAARADLCRRLGRKVQARSAYLRALELSQQAPERRYFERRLAELGGEEPPFAAELD